MKLTLPFLSTLFASTFAASVARDSGCKDYIIISTRGTGEPQGPSQGFIDMINKTLKQVPNGEEYDTVYPATFDQNDIIGVQDIIDKIKNGLKQCPNQKYALLGYSQGADATVNAINNNQFTDDMSDATKAIVVIGNPLRRAGKQSNVSGYGADNAHGVGIGKSIPDDWDKSGKILDFCLSDDCVCNVTCSGSRVGHLFYRFKSDVQDKGAQHLISHLQN